MVYLYLYLYLYLYIYLFLYLYLYIYLYLSSPDPGLPSGFQASLAPWALSSAQVLPGLGNIEKTKENEGFGSLRPSPKLLFFFFIYLALPLPNLEKPMKKH